jgi:hypothetical protein
MTTYEAILKAADFIESHPEQYNMLVTDIPSDAHDRGCMVGWAQHFLGLKGMCMRHYDIFGWRNGPNNILTVMGYFDYKKDLPSDSRFRVMAVTTDAEAASTFLRHFAQRYRPIPQAVLEIFKETEPCHESIM